METDRNKQIETRETRKEHAKMGLVSGEFDGIPIRPTTRVAVGDTPVGISDDVLKSTDGKECDGIHIFVDGAGVLVAWERDPDVASGVGIRQDAGQTYNAKSSYQVLKRLRFVSAVPGVGASLNVTAFRTGRL